MSDILTAPPEAQEPVHTSVLLRKLIREAPEGYFTLGWLIEGMPGNSFGVIILFLSLIGILPVISIPARLLIMVFAIQIIAGYKAPVLPQRIMQHKLPSKNLGRLNRYAIPALEKLETFSRPRWGSFLVMIRPIAALTGLLVTFVSIPLPLGPDLPATLVTVMIALAYIEHDGILLSFALTFGCVLLTIVAAIFL